MFLKGKEIFSSEPTDFFPKEGDKGSELVRAKTNIFHYYCVVFNIIMFLAVQNSSIGDLVTDSLTESLTFTFAIQRAILETCDH